MNWGKIVLGFFFLLTGVAIGLLIKSHLSAQEIPVQSQPRTNLPSIPTEVQQSLTVPQMSSTSNENPPVPPANPGDPAISQHTLPSGGRTDIVQIGPMIVSQPEAYTGDDITFTLTIQNVAYYKKFIKQLCFNSNEGNFGCSPGFNLNPRQVFSISNSGRFTSSGVKSVEVTWTQDGANFYSPVNAFSGSVTIL